MCICVPYYYNVLQASSINEFCECWYMIKSQMPLLVLVWHTIPARTPSYMFILSHSFCMPLHTCMQGCDVAEAGGWWDSGRGHPPVCTEQAATGARPHKPPLTTVRDEGAWSQYWHCVTLYGKSHLVDVLSQLWWHNLKGLSFSKLS